MSNVTRCNFRLSLRDAVDEGNDIELEKSNVLLMGPTGSGAFESCCLLFRLFYYLPIPVDSLYVRR